MTPERWTRIKEVFDAALEKEPAARGAFLDQECGDADVRREVDSLLAAHAESDGFLETPVLTSVPDLPRGTRVGPYEIAESIGAGGMGEVYRARDTRLERDVAIKVLPAHIAADAARVKRFEQEARAASALNHPNIVAVYDTGWHDGLPYIVTELLEGETLAERLVRGALPLRRALECAQQIAAGLVAAHERGIVHRDLKPANLFVTEPGQIKILDFGVAKLARTMESVTDAATTPGLVVGTVGYMSPEQVRAQPVDSRSDQFALGCVLYEMLTGRQPVQRASAAQSMAAVIEAEPPPIDETNLRVPRAIAWLVERCLAKEPADRYASTRDLERDLELAIARLAVLTQERPAPPARPVATRVRRALLQVAVLAGAVGLTWWLARRDGPPAAPPAAVTTVPMVRYLTHTGRDSSPAASPDGNTIAFAARRDGRRRIWLQQVATGNEAPLTDGDDDFPRFAPDGSSILFARAAGGRVALYRVALVGGEQRKVVDDALYGDFSPDGRRIVFVRQIAEGAGITSIVATTAPDGSDVRELARLEATAYPNGAFVAPRWSPDGRWIVATQTTLQLGEPTVVALIDAATGHVQRVTPPGAAVVWRGALAWAGPDEVVFVEASVVAQQTGTSSRVVLWDVANGRTRPLLSSPSNMVAVDVLGPGRLVLQTRALHQNLREVPLDPAGVGTGGRMFTHGNAADRQPIVAPDGERVLFSSNRSGNLDIWALSRSSGAVTRLTDDPAQDSDPAFMPDGRLLWSSNRSGAFEIWVAAADGSGAHQITRDGFDAENPVATPDGAWIIYASGNPGARGITKVRPDGTGATLMVPGNAILPEVSPDGVHVAYVADEGTERSALRVVRLADGAIVFEIQLPAWNTGGNVDQGRSRWLPDGSGLVYVARDGANYGIYAQPFAPGSTSPGERRRVAWFGPDLDAESMAVTPDGTALVVSFREQLDDLVLAADIGGLAPTRRR
jgi:Tol biopolymer transport system component